MPDVHNGVRHQLRRRTVYTVTATHEGVDPAMRLRKGLILLVAAIVLAGCGQAAAPPVGPFDQVLSSGDLEVKVHVPQRTAPAGGALAVDATVTNRSTTRTIPVQLDCVAVWVDLYDAQGQLIPRPQPMCMPQPVPFAPGESRALHGGVRLEGKGSYGIEIEVAGQRSERVSIQAK